MDGQGVRVDTQKAIDFYKEGANKGDYFCFVKMTPIFIESKHFENAYKSFEKFMFAGEQCGGGLHVEFSNKKIMFMFHALWCVSLHAPQRLSQYLVLTTRHRSELIAYIDNKLNSQSDSRGVKTVTTLLLAELKLHQRDGVASISSDPTQIATLKPGEPGRTLGIVSWWKRLTE